MTTKELASLNTSGDLARLTLRRPPMNFLSYKMLRQMLEAVLSLGDSPPSRALVLDSEGPTFCAGLDMGEHAEDTLFLQLEEYHDFVKALNAFPRPTIAVVKGMALGAGNEILAFCDFVLASEKSTFGQPEVNVGSIPTLAPVVLPGLVGERRALEMILTGKLVPAAEAQRIGLIHKAVPEDQLHGEVESLLNTIRGLSKPVMALAIESVRHARTNALQGSLRELQSLYLNQLMDLEDAVEGVNAFVEKRSPKWKHR